MQPNKLQAHKIKTQNVFICRRKLIEKKKNENEMSSVTFVDCQRYIFILYPMK